MHSHLCKLSQKVELWAGVECSMVRVGDRVRDQLALTGHADRMEDLDLIAGLGIKKIRYPVLWERSAPDDPDACDWQWSDERLARLRELGITPIVGFVHHGNGPRYTNLLDPQFPDLLSAYAEKVAARYPWLDAYTPINEPLTTARFSCLYGHWYPHEKNDAAFIKALLYQCRGVAQAMQAIRRINPAAKLVQTEDIGCTFSTPPLAYQAEFENQRRFLSLDLLCGKVGCRHPLWHYLRRHGATENDLAWFYDKPCPPDILGINYYITSERFLDHRLDRYPAHVHGGNETHRYADVEAIRVLSEGVSGYNGILEEVWSRYQLPIAITEIQLGSTRDEQLRWLMEAWDAVGALKKKGVDIVGITPWSIYGAVDWNSLLVRSEGYYESGLWDVRSPRPRPTILAKAVASLAGKGVFDHPVLHGSGWWRRASRILYPPHTAGIQKQQAEKNGGRPLLIAGAGGMLGRAFRRLCEERGLAFYAAHRSDMDISDAKSVETLCDEIRPWAVINAAGYAPDAAGEFHKCWRAEVQGNENLAMQCARRSVPFMTFSSDHVFDGCHNRAYVESDRDSPRTYHGQCKRVAEKRIMGLLPDALVIRTSAIFSPWDAHCALNRTLAAMASGATIKARADTIISPTYLPDLIHASLNLLIDGEKGIWHLANQGILSWYDLVAMAAGIAGIIPRSIESVSLADMPPRCTALGSERGFIMPLLDNALSNFVRARSLRAAA